MQTTQDQAQSLQEPVFFASEPQYGYFLKLPCELLLHVMSFLSMGSIRNLMVNRSLRSTCEKGLYTSIFIGKHPRRSLLLLETFMIRPDLALLVQHLEICGSYCETWSKLLDEIPKVLKPDGTNALRLAKNIRSLALLEPNDWIYSPERTGFRDAVSKMKLTHLKIEKMFDGTIWQGCSQTQWRNWEGDLGKEIWTVLQAQPLLESLSFVECSFSDETVENLQTHLTPSNAPRLKYLSANPKFAMTCIESISGLECLEITEGYLGWVLGTSMEKSPAENRASIRKLSLYIREPYNPFWKISGRIVALFPSTETLQLVIPKYWGNSDAQFESGEDFCSTMIQIISTLPILRRLEITGEMNYSAEKGMAGAQEDFLAECKIVCPQLESFIDHSGVLWEYALECDSRGRGIFKQIGVVKEMEDRGFKDDLSDKEEEKEG